MPRPAPASAPGPAPGAPNLLGLVAGGFKDLTGHDDIQGALHDARRGPNDTTVLAVRRDGDTHVETIAPVVTPGVKPVGFGDPLPARAGPIGHLEETVVIDQPPTLPDPDALQRFIRAHQRALLYCYEAELKHHPDLQGKLVVRFMLTAQGRTGDVSTMNDSLGNPAVAACIRSSVQRWIFPFKPEDDFAVEFPVLFTSVR
jgi:hypothetical protein